MWMYLSPDSRDGWTGAGGVEWYQRDRCRGQDSFACLFSQKGVVDGGSDFFGALWMVEEPAELAGARQ